MFRYIDDFIRTDFNRVENPEDLFVDRSRALEGFKEEYPDRVSAVSSCKYMRAVPEVVKIGN